MEVSVIPGPVSMQVVCEGVNLEMEDGATRAFVRMTFATQQGVNIFYIPAEHVGTVASKLMTAKQETETGLIVPDMRIVPNNGEGYA